jgi:RNA polymerase-binding protein DksA
VRGVDPLLVERRLRLRAQELRSQITTLRARAGNIAATEVGDAKDAADASAQAVVDDAEVERDFAELRDIRMALAAIGEGRYGICTECGSPIDARRLAAQPTAFRCVDCQAVAEGGRR